MSSASLPEGYKQAKVGVIPEEWHDGTISSLFHVVTGTTPSTSSPDYWEDGTRVWITPADLSNNNGRVYISDCERKITDLAVRDYNLSCLPIGSIIVSTRAPVGYVAINRNEAYINQGCKGLIPKENAGTEVYYYYYLKSKTSELTRMSGGSTFKELSKKSLEQFPIPIPQDYECRQIGNILSTVDAAIAATDKVIAKTEDLKRGLMQDLLTKGLDEEGRVRSEETHAFCEKDGMPVPVEWTGGPISSIAYVNPRTDTSHLKENSPVSFIPMENVREDGTVRAMEIRPYSEVQNGYTIFTDGDILFAKITPCMENGKGALVRNLKNGVGFGSTEFHVLRPVDPEDAEFIYQLSRSPSFRNKATRYFMGSAGQQRVSKDIFTHYLCPIPKPKERPRIAAVLSAVDRNLTAERNHRARLQTLKQGLMQDLLTGRTRVPLNGGETHGA